MEEKLQHCEQKLQYLVERVANLPPDSHSPDENNEVRGGPSLLWSLGTHTGLSWMAHPKMGG